MGVFGKLNCGFDNRFDIILQENSGGLLMLPIIVCPGHTVIFNNEEKS